MYFVGCILIHSIFYKVFTNTVYYTGDTKKYINE